MHRRTLEARLCSFRRHLASCVHRTSSIELRVAPFDLYLAAIISVEPLVLVMVSAIAVALLVFCLTFSRMQNVCRIS